MGIAKDVAAGIHVEVPADRGKVRSLARSAAAAASGWSFKGGVIGLLKVSELREAERGLTFAVSAPNGRALMQFRVEDEPGPTGGSLVRVGIGDHLQTRAVGTFGTPVDRKRIAGFPAYDKFLRTFAASLETLG
jgi:hypothetical protein